MKLKFLACCLAMTGASLLAMPASAQISDDVIKVGMLDDMSGPFSDYSGPGAVEAMKLAVEDFGVGVEQDKLDRLFTPFYSTKPQGMGVGLSICRAIADVHGGELRAARNVGPGMTFEFVIPAASEIM